MNSTATPTATNIVTNTAASIAWLYRRAGFGLGPGELDRWVADGAGAALDRLVHPERFGVPAAPDPWRDMTFVNAPDRQASADAIDRWVHLMSTTSRPLEDWMTWFWHDHFATSLAKVRFAGLMVGHVRTLRRLALGRFPDLLRAVTIDPAMLIWLDGRRSTGTEPNENYGREVLELFTLGIGHFAEADVRAGARALTGWGIDLAGGTGRFRPVRHDDSAQRYLGRTAVHDVDTVVHAITSHPACAPFIASKLATAILGQADPSVVNPLADRFAADGMQLLPLVQGLLEAGLRSRDATPPGTTPVVLGPVAWLAAVQRATGVRLPPGRSLVLLQSGGQVPMAPPNVGGWPSGRSWLATSAVAARLDLAGLIAAQTDATNPARQAADAGDVGALAVALGRPEGFSASTISALAKASAMRAIGHSAGVARLTLALAAPDLALA